ncbi:hypothetical protein L3X37_06010 [Sabulilitoribacter arenilitoris]|uniref:Uncharacterized protein n=1 Tax=Wocania arenilitoris TaxID=2044858 RepID=A0AAE3EM39_9FLAO|nr:hypothetical protein [Wocania arenilitoris]MCF7567920.1 hypothetical protein [Wocania arenilitoris]
MHKKHLLFFLTFVSLNICFSQSKNEYFGVVVIGDSISMTYRINIIEKNGSIKGYSVTDLGGEHETKSNIFGEYDKINKKLNFRETGIVYTKSHISQEDFCFMNVTVKNFTFDRTKSINTNFFGLFDDNTECIHGKIILNSMKKIEARLNKVSKKINKSKRISDSIKSRVNPLKIMDTLNMNILRKNQTLSIFSKSKKIKLTVYDGGKEDGDKISISSNGKSLINNFEVKNNKKVFTINIIEDKTSILIKANNEGNIAPNTVVIEFDDGKNDIQALSNLKVGETTQIDILKAK